MESTDPKEVLLTYYSATLRQKDLDYLKDG